MVVDRAVGAVRRAWQRATLAFALLTCLAGAAAAQSAVCRQLEAELASLDRPTTRPGRVANAERAMLARVQGNINALGCNRGFTLFGPQPPAQCSGLKAQASAIQGRIADIEAPRQVASAANPRRRAQLMASLDAYGCRNRQAAAAPPPQQQSRSLLEVLFGRPPPPSQPQYATAPPPGGSLPPLVDGVPVDRPNDPNAKKFSGGGNLPVCVRTCDGFFFPINYEGTGANDQYDEMCQASCPNAPTEVYWMPAGADLDRAANEEGVNYSQLPNAFKYRQSYDPACSCKARNQTWAVALQQADSIMGARRNDITVTAETSDQMARPTPLKELRGARGTRKADVAAQQAPPADARPDSNLATNSTTTSGIGPRPAEGRVLGAEDGEKREVAGADGDRRTIRVVNPHRQAIDPVDPVMPRAERRQTRPRQDPVP